MLSLPHDSDSNGFVHSAIRFRVRWFFNRISVFVSKVWERVQVLAEKASHLDLDLKQELFQKRSWEGIELPMMRG